MPCPEPLGKAVKRRARAGGKPPKTGARETVTSKRGGASGAVRRRNPSIADLQDELDRRTRERDEALEQQTATSEVLRVISNSPGDLQPVFATILENAVRICDAKFGALYLNQGDGFRATAMHNAPPAYEQARSGVYIRLPALAFGVQRPQSKRRRSPTLPWNKDMSRADPFVVSAVALGSYRSVFSVPMFHEDKLIGVITIFRQEVRPFTDKQIALVQYFAKQAVIAIENARLFTELRRSLEQQTATAEVLSIISSSKFELQPILQSVVDTAARLCRADAAVIFRFEDDVYRFAAGYSLDPAYLEIERRTLIASGSGTLIGRAAMSRQVVRIDDAWSDPLYEKKEQAKLGAGFRSMMGVPLMRDGEAIGVIGLARSRVEPFAESEVDLVTTFADQAVIAIENVRLFEAEQRRTQELTESLEQQTATADVLRVISSSPGDLEPVFGALLEKAVRLCGAKFGNLHLREGAASRTVAMHNAPAAYVEARLHTLIQPGPHTALAQAMRTKRAVQVEDVKAGPAYRARDPLVVSAVELGGVRTMLVVPMLKDDELVGSINIYRQDVMPFNQKQIDIVSNFAAQAVIAVENARLLNELRQRTDELGRSVGELRALGEVSQAVDSTLELETVLDTIVAKAVQLSSTDAGAIYVFNDQQREFRLRATYGMDRELIEALTQRHIGVDEPNITPAFLAGEPIQMPDLREAVSSAANDIVLRAGFRALLIAPLLRGGDIAGMLVVRRRTPGAFVQNTVDLIKTFAAQSAVAIENARLFKNVEASLEDLRNTQDRLVQTQKLAALGQLTAGIAHEIKNPLNFVNNFSGVSAELLDELQESFGKVKADANTIAEISELTNTLRDNLQKIVQHGRRANSIVRNMLLHSREGSGEHRSVDINTLVDEAVNLAYHGARAERKGFNITLERSFDPAAGRADCFPQEITRVLLNLIANGFYHRRLNVRDR